MFAFQPLRTVNLTQHDVFTENDIFVEIRSGDVVRKTEVIENDNNPSFSKYNLHVLPISSSIEILVKEKDYGKSSTLKRIVLSESDLSDDFSREIQMECLIFKATKMTLCSERSNLAKQSADDKLQKELHDLRQEKVQIENDLRTLQSCHTQLLQSLSNISSRLQTDCELLEDLCCQ